MSARTTRLTSFRARWNDDDKSPKVRRTEMKRTVKEEDAAMMIRLRNSKQYSGLSGPARVNLLNFSIFAALLMVISASSTISAIHSCNRGRFVMNSTWGLITNGPENYREDSYCVWLIEGNQRRTKIIIIN